MASSAYRTDTAKKKQQRADLPTAEIAPGADAWQKGEAFHGHDVSLNSLADLVVKLALSAGKLILSVTNPDSGSATEELEVEYASDALDIGFNSRYLLDIASQIESEAAVLKLADPGSPTLIQDKDAGNALYVLMPMRV